MDTYNMTDREAKKYKRNVTLAFVARIALFVISLLTVANIAFIITNANGTGITATVIPSFVAFKGILLTEETGDGFYTVIFVILGFVLALAYAAIGLLSRKKKKLIILGFVLYMLECIYYLMAPASREFAFTDLFLTATLPHIVFLAILIAGGFAAEGLATSTLTKRKMKKAAKAKEKKEKEEKEW